MSRPNLEDTLWTVLLTGSLAPLASHIRQPELLAMLCDLTIGKPTATQIAIRARVDFLILIERGWKRPAILEVLLRAHFNGRSVSSMASKIVLDNAGSKVNAPAEKLFKRMSQMRRSERFAELTSNF